MDLRQIVDTLIQTENFTRVINDPLAQFGAPNRRYVGAEILPEVMVPENSYVEEAIRYRTIVANDGTRYSPVQIKQGVLTGSFEVHLGDSDIGSHFTSADYDALIKLIERINGGYGNTGAGVARPTMEAMARILNWVDLTLRRPLYEKNEKMRWEAICNASIARTGDNGYVETVTIPNPTGHRPNAGGVWSNNAYDPYTDIIAGAEFLAAKGYTVTRMVTGTDVRSKLSMNTNIRTRVGRISIISSTIVGLPGRATLNRMNEMFSEDNLPPLETYDLQYRTHTSSGYFFPRGTFAMIAGSRDQLIDRGDLEPAVMPRTVANTIGYVGMGRPAGQSTSGAVVVLRPEADSKPPRIEGEAWQVSLPVVQEPEAIYVIKNIT